MSMSRRFLLEDFAPPIVEEENLLPPEPEITEADVESARRAGIQLGVQQGFETGEAKAREELQKLFAQAAEENDTAVEKLFQQLAAQFEVIFAEQQAEISRHTVQMLAMTRLLWQRLMPEYFARHGCDEVCAIVEECLQTLRYEEKIVLEYGAENAEKLVTRLEPLKKLYSGRTELEFRASDELGVSDVRLRWGEGFAERNTAEMLAIADTVLAKTLEEFPQAGEAAPEAKTA